jgi:hypothetical protein
MRVDRTRHRVARRVVALSIAVVVVGMCTTALAAAGAVTQSTNLGGAWSGSYSGGYAGTFTIHWKQSGASLKGTIALSNPHGSYYITGSIKGKGIKFGAVGVGAVYSGSVAASGRSMSGHWTSGPAKGTWKAHKL